MVKCSSSSSEFLAAGMEGLLQGIGRVARVGPSMSPAWQKGLMTHAIRLRHADFRRHLVGRPPMGHTRNRSADPAASGGNHATGSRVFSGVLPVPVLVV